MVPRSWVPLAVSGPLLLAVVAGAPPRLCSAELSVDELVARAVEGNPDLKVARAEVDAAVGRLRQAGLRPNPMLDLGFQKALGPDNTQTIGLTVPLDLGGRRQGRVGVAERELAMKRTQALDRERRLRAEVRAKAGEYFAARRSHGVTDELLSVNRDALALVQQRVRQGAAPALDESLMLVEVNRLDASRQLLASRLEIAVLQLKALAGMAPDAPLTLRGDLVPAAPRLERDDAVRRALAARPDLEAARADVALTQARVRKEEADGRWDASINVGYQRQEMGFGLMGLTESGATRPIQDVFHFFGAGVSITLPVRNRNQGNVAAARAETEAASRREEFATLTVRQEVEAAFTQWEAAGRSLYIYERGVREVARRNLDVVRKSHELGRLGFLDVIAEQRRYIEIEQGYTEALRQLYDAAVEIRRVVNEP
ncbi:MAG TPA: TolC family protein [Methylomirabilota bacterium]|jgi:cobalt-zinc-cadmium efflux system outer membrane protein|nr:TolC family protein [Methylomirabilota bacterium]